MGRLYHCGRHHPVGPGLYNTRENELIRHKHTRINSLFSALDCGWDVTDSKFLLLWLLSDREVHVVWTMSQTDNFSLMLLFVSIILSQQWGKKTKIHGFWGSNSDPLYWLGYSPVPKEISASGYQELAQGEDSLHHPLPSSPYVLSTPILLCWGFSSEEETKKELKHSWFLVKRRGTHSPWPVVAPSWLLLSLEEHLCWAYALSLPLSGAVGVAQSKECTLRIGVCISYFTHEREKKKQHTGGRTYSGSQSQGAAHHKVTMT